MAKCIQIFLIFFLSTNLLYPQLQNNKFDHITMDDGLSGNFIKGIFQDSKGFMWICTRSGLNKYDGYRFTVYKHDENNPHSISINWTRFVYEDTRGQLWIGTHGGGLERFDRQHEKFIHYKHDINNPNSICSNYILTMHEDSNGDLWIGTGNGVSQLIRTQVTPDSEHVSFINYKYDADNRGIVGHSYIFSIYEDKNRDLWVAIGNNNIDKFDRTKKQFNTIIKSEDVDRFWDSLNYSWGSSEIIFMKQLPSDKEHQLTIASGNFICKYDIKNNAFINYYKNLTDFLYKNNQGRIYSYQYTREGDLWIGSARGGLYLVPNNESRILNYRNDPKDPGSLSSNKIFDIYEDRRGNIWIGTMGAGINKYDRNKQKFVNFEIETDNTYNSVSAITEDLRGSGRILWLGTSGKRGNGLLKFDLKTGEIKNYQGHINSSIWSIYQDNNNLNILWIGSMGSGLHRFDIEKEQIERISYREGSEKSFNSFSYVTSIVSAEKGYLWIGTLSGLFKLNTKTNRLIPFLQKPGNSVSLSDNNISVLCNSNYHNENVLWIGTRYGGLHRFDHENMTLVNFKNDESDSSMLNDNYISSIHEDKSGMLWIGTPKGLNRFNRETMTFSQVMDKDRKLAVDITGILEDKKGNLWLNTNSRLFKFDPGTEKFKNYNKNDGLRISNFDRPAHFKSKSGEMFLGGDKGVIAFHPDNIKDNPHIPPVVITDFRIFNKSVKVGSGEESPILQKSITETDEIQLSHDQSVFSFEFAALDFTSPVKNKYAYKMKGVDPDWVYTNASQRFATYTQLDPGEYTFRVKGSNNDGVWNEQGVSVKIIILPPWWKTNLAYAIYILLVIGLIYSWRRYDLKRIKLKHALELEHVHAENLEKINNVKSRFFANISHEFRTPLTLIEGPVKQLLDGTLKGNIKEQYQLILRNTRRLLNLVNQLLDLSKLDAGSMELKTEPVDVIVLLKGITMTFVSKAEQKNIRLNFNCSSTQFNILLDKEKFETIITNLLSNAFKFTPDGGRIEVYAEFSKSCTLLPDTKSMKNSDTFFVIKISNSGDYIPEERLQKIFDRFYQSDAHKYSDIEGTGIGLALCKELTELHRGNIEVESKPGKGTTFTLVFPVLIEKVIDSADRGEFSFLSQKDTSSEKADIYSKNNHNIRQSNEYPLILIVEDNADVRRFIRSGLGTNFNYIDACDGRQGFERAVEKIPDLIICDVMMPEMDGLELCAKIKKDERTSHIPVILLTARAAAEDKIFGLESGADDYIAKPFQIDELHVRIKNIIEQRKRLRERFIKEYHLQPGDISLSSVDERFLNRVMQIIEEKISDPEFGVDEFVQEIHLSRSVLYRKIKALTGQSVKHFIRSVRLRRAALILEKAAASVTETAYQVGFGNPAYFTECFQKQFGVLPSKFVRKNNNIH